MKKLNALFMTVIFLSGCDSGSTLEGVYKDRMGMSEYHFNDDGTVVMSTFTGATMEFDYEIEDDKVKIETLEGRMVLAILENGNLSGPGGELARQ